MGREHGHGGFVVVSLSDPSSVGVYLFQYKKYQNFFFVFLGGNKNHFKFNLKKLNGTDYNQMENCGI